MTLFTLAAKNLGRNRFRSVMTIIAIAITMLALLALRTVIVSWYAGIDYAAKDRIATRNKVTFIMPLPKAMVEKVRAGVDRNGQALGLTDVTWANWFGGKNPKFKDEFFATLAVDGPSFLKVYEEIEVAPAEQQAWLSNRRGAVVGDVIAKKFGWKVGDKVALESSIFPGAWDFEVSAIYKAKSKAVDRSSVYFHWEYLNETLPPAQKDKIGWIISRVRNSSEAATISKRIDALFEDGGDQTLTMSEKQMGMSMMGMFSAVLKAINVVSIVLLLIMMLIVGNTIAMGVRERTNEYGMLRAIGFSGGQLQRLIVGEALVVALVGAIVGIGIGVLFINGAVGPSLEESMGSFFPYFRVTPGTMMQAIVAAVTLGALASLLPARRAAKLNVIEAIRRIG